MDLHIVTINVMKSLGFLLVFLPVFVTSYCDFRHSDDGICKIIEPVFCLFVDNPASENYIL